MGVLASGGGIISASPSPPVSCGHVHVFVLVRRMGDWADCCYGDEPCCSPAPGGSPPASWCSRAAPADLSSADRPAKPDVSDQRCAVRVAGPASCAALTPTPLSPPGLTSRSQNTFIPFILSVNIPMIKLLGQSEERQGCGYHGNIWERTNGLHMFVVVRV